MTTIMLILKKYNFLKINGTYLNIMRKQAGRFLNYFSNR